MAGRAREDDGREPEDEVPRGSLPAEEGGVSNAFCDGFGDVPPAPRRRVRPSDMVVVTSSGLMGNYSTTTPIKTRLDPDMTLAVGDPPRKGKAAVLARGMPRVQFAFAVWAVAVPLRYWYMAWTPVTAIHY